MLGPTLHGPLPHLQSQSQTGYPFLKPLKVGAVCVSEAMESDRSKDGFSIFKSQLVLFISQPVHVKRCLEKAKGFKGSRSITFRL